MRNEGQFFGTKIGRALSDEEVAQVSGAAKGGENRVESTHVETTMDHADGSGYCDVDTDYVVIL